VPNQPDTVIGKETVDVLIFDIKFPFLVYQSKFMSDILFSHLPDEILVQIFQFCDKKCLISLNRVCRDVYTFMTKHDEQVYKFHSPLFFELSLQNVRCQTWREYFIKKQVREMALGLVTQYHVENLTLDKYPPIEICPVKFSSSIHLFRSSVVVGMVNLKGRMITAFEKVHLKPFQAIGQLLTKIEGDFTISSLDLVELTEILWFVYDIGAACWLNDSVLRFLIPTVHDDSLMLSLRSKGICTINFKTFSLKTLLQEPIVESIVETKKEKCLVQ
jgi:hypothetical protein